MGGVSNTALNKAKCAKNDEYYTKLSDIQNEMQYHIDSFRNKVVYCNCDNPYESNFFKYFIQNFNNLNLKKLITTNYGTYNPKKTQLTLSDKYGVYIPAYMRKPAYKTEIEEVTETDTIEDIIKDNVIRLKGNGDFRTPECVKLLKQADIVVTNPPFSLFRQYVSLLMKYKKRFIILGNQNAITYNEIFQYIHDHKIWLGKSIHKGGIYFKIPDKSALDATQYKVDAEGNKYVCLSAIRWFTNMGQKYSNDILQTDKTYSPYKYPKYTNSEGIDVSKIKDIPTDYDGVMGVPITFLDHYNPEQFEILNRLQRPIIRTETGYQAIYSRLLIKRKL